jgi:phospholipid/cholesterol/gamma-HCH transport system substrate-binding protein
MSARGSRSSVASTASLVKLLAFVVVTLLAFGVLAATIANVQLGAKVRYTAIFTDATGLQKGDDVRIAGVRVGQVTSIGVVSSGGQAEAKVGLKVLRSSALTQGTGAVIRYRNLIGQRFVALTQGAGGSAQLPSGATIPASRTQPALDLDVLFNGFKPLFAALSPNDVNELSGEIIQVLQGEGGSIDQLLAHTASLTSTLADRDAVIGQTVTNLNAVLGTVQQRDGELGDLVDQMTRFVSGLAADRTVIGSSLTNINSLADQTADLLVAARPPLKADISQLQDLAALLNEPANTQLFKQFAQSLPGKLATITRTATYGSFFNFYLCHFDGTVVVPTATKDVSIPVADGIGSVDAARCT